MYLDIYVEGTRSTTKRHRDVFPSGNDFGEILAPLHDLGPSCHCTDLPSGIMFVPEGLRLVDKICRQW